MLVPDPARPMWVGITGRDQESVDWKQWPTDRPLPDEAFSSDGLLITSRAKLRPCVVLTLRDEIDAFGEALLLPISALKPMRPAHAALIRANQVPFSHFIPGDARRSFDDATVDFRWTWRLRSADLDVARHEGELDPETLVRLLFRYRDYLYLAPS